MKKLRHILGFNVPLETVQVISVMCTSHSVIEGHQ